MGKICIFCKHWFFYSGICDDNDSGFYDEGCVKTHWGITNDCDEREYRTIVQAAAKCPDFEAVKE